MSDDEPEPVEMADVDHANWESEADNRAKYNADPEGEVPCPADGCAGEIAQIESDGELYPNPHDVYSCSEEGCRRYIDSETRMKMRNCMYYGNTPDMDSLESGGE